MFKFKHLLIILLLLAFLSAQPVIAVSPQTVKIELVNNQPFPVRMPIAVKSGNLKGETWKTLSGKAVQKDGDDLIFIADLPASSAQNFKLQNDSPTKTALRSNSRARNSDGFRGRFFSAIQNQKN